MTCPFLKSEICELASQIAKSPCTTTKKICESCLASDRPRRLNAINAKLITKHNKEISQESLDAIILQEADGKGFGSLLHSVFGIYFKDSSTCGCSGHEDILNSWSPEYIKKNIDKVVFWICQSAINRKLPHSKLAIKMLLVSLLHYHTMTNTRKAKE